MVMNWRRIEERDFPLLREWLERPHVKRWWNHETTEEAVARDFGPVARGEEPSEDLLVFLDGRPLGLVQRSCLDDYPQYAATLRTAAPVPPGAMTIDYFIGDPASTGRGIGTDMIRALVQSTLADHPHAPCILVPVVVANRPSWRALERAGLHRVGRGRWEPDNPVDDPEHHLYRIDRPSTGE